MRAVYLNEGKVEVRDMGELKGEGIKVRVKSAGICGSDLHMHELKFPMECASGHEAAGVLEDGTPVVGAADSMRRVSLLPGRPLSFMPCGRNTRYHH